MLILDVFLSRLMPSVPGCPEPLARQALLDSTIEFCEETGVVKVTTDPIGLQAGNAVYSVDVPMQQQVVTVQRAWYGTRELIAAPSAMVSEVEAYTGNAAPSTGQEPTHYLEFAPGEVSLFPTPGEGATAMLVFRATTKPTRSASSVENVLFEDWAEVIVAGALRRLHGTPDTPFSSDQLSMRQAGLFQLGVSKARQEALRGRVRGSMLIAHRAFV